MFAVHAPRSVVRNPLKLVWLALAASTVNACAHKRAEAPPPARVQYGEPARQVGGAMMYTGEVIGVDRVPVTEQNATTPHIQITLDKSPRVSLVLGPGWYLKRKGLEFHHHDVVTVVGHHQDNDDETRVIAKEVKVDGASVPLRDATGRGLWEQESPPLPSAPPATASASPSAPAPPSPPASTPQTSATPTAPAPTPPSPRPGVPPKPQTP